MRYIESQFKNIIAIQQIGLDSDLNSGVQFSQSQERREELWGSPVRAHV